MASLDENSSSLFLQGTPFNDTLLGSAANDTLQGLAGNDLLFGNAGSDLLQGNEDADTLFGGQGNDTLDGGSGDDVIYGGKGQDILIGGPGRDLLTGGAGDDFFVINRSEQASTIAEANEITDFGKGNDQIVLTDGLKFSDLNISFAEGKAVMIDKLTGKYLAVLLGVANLDESRFISLIGGLEEAQVLPLSITTNISGQTINLEVAKTPVEQAIGLMYRSEIPDDRGMLFPIDPPRVIRFWMKNVSVPLDMVFLQNGVVQAVIPNVPPCVGGNCPTYGPDVPVDSVLELRGGRAAELGLKVGDRIPNLS